MATQKQVQERAAPMKPGVLEDVVQQALAEARRAGADAAEAQAAMGDGLQVTVRLGDVETVERTRDKELAVTVYLGQRSGSASTSDFRPEAIRETVRAACTIARYTAADPCSGLADPARLARVIPDLDLYHPWDMDAERAIGLAIECEAAARGADRRIANSEGASVSSHQGLDVYGNSLGFMGARRGTRHGLSCAVIASDGDGMQRDYWYASARDPALLEPAAAVGRTAAERAVRRLGARKIKTQQADVLFEAPVASSLLSHFVAATRGTSLYRRASFLLDSLGKPVFSSRVQIVEDPLLPKRLGSAAYDAEGVATARREIVRDGRLEGYFLDSYSARKLGLETTANAGGVHNLTLMSTGPDLAGLMRAMGRGLLVTELIGFGVNPVTGDYSRGAAGFWIENGEIAHPVEEITIAGRLADMFTSLAAVGSDVDTRGRLLTGSIWIPGLMIAGR